MPLTCFLCKIKGEKKKKSPNYLVIYPWPTQLSGILRKSCSIIIGLVCAPIIIPKNFTSVSLIAIYSDGKKANKQGIHHSLKFSEFYASCFLFFRSWKRVSCLFLPCLLPLFYSSLFCSTSSLNVCSLTSTWRLVICKLLNCNTRNSFEWCFVVLLFNFQKGREC